MNFEPLDTGYYILKNKRPIQVSFYKWAIWFDSPDRIVKQEEIDGVQISTVFIGYGHLFETMIFGGDHDGYQCRCDTWQEAEAEHQKAVDLINGKIKN